MDADNGKQGQNTHIDKQTRHVPQHSSAKLVSAG
jgi:hypothetical protein